MVKMDQSAKVLGRTGSQANVTCQSGWHGALPPRPKSLSVTWWAGAAPESVFCISWVCIASWWDTPNSSSKTPVIDSRPDYGGKKTEAAECCSPGQAFQANWAMSSSPCA